MSVCVSLLCFAVSLSLFLSSLSLSLSLSVYLSMESARSSALPAPAAAPVLLTLSFCWAYRGPVVALRPSAVRGGERPPPSRSRHGEALRENANTADSPPPSQQTEYGIKTGCPLGCRKARHDHRERCISDHDESSYSSLYPGTSPCRSLEEQSEAAPDKHPSLGGPAPWRLPRSELSPLPDSQQEKQCIKATHCEI